MRATLKLDSVVYRAYFPSHTSWIEINPHLDHANLSFSDVFSNVDGVPRLFNPPFYKWRPSAAVQAQTWPVQKSISNLDENCKEFSVSQLERQLIRL